MKVAELAAELEVPTSTILAQCQRFGIDAAWAGAELSGADVVVIRAELAADEPLDLTGVEPSGDDAMDGSPETVAVGAAATDGAAEAPGPAAGALPPTAVGSMPGIIDDVTPEPEPDTDPSGRAPGFAMAGSGAGGSVDPNATRRVAPRPAPTKRRLDRSARNSVFALIVAVACFVGSNFVDLAVFVVLLWLLTALSLVIAVYDGIRGRRRVQTHPDRYRGLWLSVVSVVVAVAGIIGLTVTVAAVVGDAPAANAPLGVGDLDSVQLARWGYQRSSRYADNGWSQPARAEDSCWSIDTRSGDSDDNQRVEVEDLTDERRCNGPHTVEVVKAFAINRDADASYPGPDGILLVAKDVCEPIFEKLAAKGVTAEFKTEYPTENGWRDGDHDVSCLAVTERRSGRLPV